MSKKSYPHIETKLVHLGRDSLNHKGMVNTPIYQTSTIIYPNIQEFLKEDHPLYKDYKYGRGGTPTVHELEKAIATLYNVNHSLITASGLSAIMNAFLGTLKSGDHALIVDTCYRGAQRSIQDEFPKLGIEYTFYDANYTDNITELIQPNTRLIFMESPGSGTFEVQDVPRLCKIAKKYNLITMLDNTWATPLNFQPFNYGIDIVVDSLSKYINGHSDVILGSITFKNEHYTSIAKTHRNYACIASPNSCYLALRGLRTLKLRLTQQYDSALQIAKMLEKHPKVQQVLYPALASSATHKLWKRDFSGASGIFGIVLPQLSQKKLYKFINSLQLFAIGLSWGGYESLVIPYDLINLKNLNNRIRPGNYIRLNIGLENALDLFQDLNNALKNI